VSIAQKMFCAMAGLVIIMTTAACSWSFSAVRRAELNSQADLECIRREISALPQIESVSEWKRSVGGRALTFRGIMPPDKYFSLRYADKDGYVGYVGFNESGSGKFEYSIQQMFPLENLTSRRMVKCTRADHDHATALMRKIDEQIVKGCKVSVVKNSLRETIPKSRHCPISTTGRETGAS